MIVNLAHVRQQRAAISRIAAAHGARNVRVFGSVARGEAGTGSDVDVLAEFEPGRSLLDLIGLQQDLSELLGQPVDVVSEGGLGRGDRILEEAVAI